ncbi:MAG: RraA family protein [Bacteroidetes bacterium]|nr:MAG: RraA family protein [Bacteroidota bacterium]RLD72123.1 MAG: RraA family protein [Bacteroidota bacterium]RLD92498.1 MAG: RraA family protein [Bacteroidota bacterium]
MKTLILTTAILLTLSLNSSAQFFNTADELIYYTSEWTGERFDDGRPKVADDILERMAKVSIEEAWGVLRSKGYNNQFEGNWVLLHDDQAVVGRALTAQYMPLRPEVMDRLTEKGHELGRVGAMNSWPIDALQQGDVYVADGFGKVVDGTLIGDNLGNAIYANSGNGVVFDAGSRDMEGLADIEGFNAFVRGFDPSYLMESMLMGINVPIRIGRATVFPGDVVLAKQTGVLFIPAHLAEELVDRAEFIMLRDMFGHEMLKKGVYTPGEIDGRWSDDIKQAFLDWVENNPDELPMSKAELDKYLKDRTW